MSDSSDIVTAIRNLPPGIQLSFILSVCLVSTLASCLTYFCCFRGFHGGRASYAAVIGRETSDLELVDLPAEHEHSQGSAQDELERGVGAADAVSDEHDDEDDEDDRIISTASSRLTGESLGLSSPLNPVAVAKLDLPDFEKATTDFNDFIEYELKKSDDRVAKIETRLAIQAVSTLAITEQRNHS
eukprot:gb/GEZN01023439.1/.p1 GENE.gb/GEZN01023439.1/~~gb/GEZN01023439.1/.p1  ORF type:complete len:194 (-),score=12.40 gb/GEZN01023439.1/:14-571(-)